MSLPASAEVVAIAPVNIAVIKYWGKRDQALILPTNSSLSGTIDSGAMRSHTTITAVLRNNDDEVDTMSLDDQEVKLSDDKRLAGVLAAIRARASAFTDDSGKVLIPAEAWPRYRLQIVSRNNFPTAAGLASSASGFACMTACLARLYGVKEQYPGELTTFARIGSGSACRSLYGGFVKWNKGEKEDGSDSIAVQVAPASHWPEMRVLIVVASSGKKHVSSTSGMQTTVETSPLLQRRIQDVPQRMADMEDAILRKDFEKFANLTMMDSNQFHAVCLDTFPPIFYLTDTSKLVIDIVHRFNAAVGATVAAYTFDAGPNAVIYTLNSHMDLLLAALLKHTLPEGVSLDSGFLNDPMKLSKAAQADYAYPEAELEPVMAKLGPKRASKVYSIIVSQLGEGAQVLSAKASDAAASAAAAN